MPRQTRVAIVGCLGRMGQRLCSLVIAHPDLTLAAAIARPNHDLIGRRLSDIVPSIPPDCHTLITSYQEEDSDALLLSLRPDAILDFSSPLGTLWCLRQAVNLGIPLVIGTTGLTAEQEAQIKTVSNSIPVIHAMNFSLGANLLIQLVATAAKALDDNFNIEIVEAHHNQKMDAPSGTALALADAACQSTGRCRNDVLVHGRHGRVGRRTVGEIGMHALRLGGVIGDHAVHFGSALESIELSHRAHDRDLFASGALKAAIWLIGQAPGMYTMGDVLFNSNRTKKDTRTNSKDLKCEN